MVVGENPSSRMIWNVLDHPRRTPACLIYLAELRLHGGGRMAGGLVPLDPAGLCRALVTSCSGVSQVDVARADAWAQVADLAP